jgi:acetyl esterase
MATQYDPKARFDITVFEEPFRRTAKGRQLMARLYQPKGKGPFPVLLDLHGGAWNNKDRTANEPMARAIAASGVLVASTDMTLAPEAPYPACVQDGHYAVRWLRWKAPGWNGDPATLGILGSSSGGHVGELIALKPRDPKYAAIPLPEAPHADVSIRYLATRSPISNTVARYQQAEKM